MSCPLCGDPNATRGGSVSAQGEIDELQCPTCGDLPWMEWEVYLGLPDALQRVAMAQAQAKHAAIRAKQADRYSAWQARRKQWDDQHLHELVARGKQWL